MLNCSNCKEHKNLCSAITTEGESKLFKGNLSYDTEVYIYCNKCGQIELIDKYVSAVKLEPCPNCECEPLDANKNDSFTLLSASAHYDEFFKANQEGDGIYFVYRIKCKNCDEVVHIEDCFASNGARANFIYGFSITDFRSEKKGL